MKLAIHVPGNVPAGPCLEAVRAGGSWDGVEVAGEALEAEEDLESLLEQYHVPLLSIDSLLPGRVARYLAETTPGLREQLLAHARRLMDRAGPLQPEAAELDLGIPRIADEVDQDLATRAQLLKSLLAIADRYRVALCLPLRQPPADFRSGALTLRLLHEVMHPACRVALAIFPDELRPDFDLRHVLRDYLYNVALMRLRYNPALGERPSREWHAEWAGILREQGYRGLVIFAPECEDAAAWRREADRLLPALQEHWRN